MCSTDEVKSARGRQIFILCFPFLVVHSHPDLNVVCLISFGAGTQFYLQQQTCFARVKGLLRASGTNTESFAGLDTRHVLVPSAPSSFCRHVLAVNPRTPDRPTVHLQRQHLTRRLQQEQRLSHKFSVPKRYGNSSDFGGHVSVSCSQLSTVSRS